MRASRRNFGHVSLAFNLKLLNYLQSFVGISIVLYSSWMLVYWNNHHAFPPYPPPAPAPHRPLLRMYRSRFRGVGCLLTAGGASAKELRRGSGMRMDWRLSSYWLLSAFIYSFMGVGIVLCSISFIGCLRRKHSMAAAFALYAVIVSLLLSAEAALVAFIAIDHRWEQDLPFDPTGELDSLRSFINNNADICKWIGIAVLVIQVLSLLVTFVLRGLTSPQRTDYDYQDGQNGGARIREPLLNPQIGPAYSSVKGDGRSGHSDLWSSLVREKRGLNGDGSNNASSSVKAKRSMLRMLLLSKSFMGEGFAVIP